MHARTVRITPGWHSAPSSGVERDLLFLKNFFAPGKYTPHNFSYFSISSRSQASNNVRFPPRVTITKLSTSIPHSYLAVAYKTEITQRFTHSEGLLSGRTWAAIWSDRAAHHAPLTGSGGPYGDLIQSEAKGTGPLERMDGAAARRKDGLITSFFRLNKRPCEDLWAAGLTVGLSANIFSEWFVKKEEIVLADLSHSALSESVGDTRRDRRHIAHSLSRRWISERQSHNKHLSWRKNLWKMSVKFEKAILEEEKKTKTNTKLITSSAGSVLEVAPAPREEKCFILCISWISTNIPWRHAAVRCCATCFQGAVAPRGPSTNRLPCFSCRERDTVTLGFWVSYHAERCKSKFDISSPNRWSQR